VISLSEMKQERVVYDPHLALKGLRLSRPLTKSKKKGYKYLG